MKINLGGVITEQANAVVSTKNRAFRNGDAVKEVLRFVNGEIVDWEDHYFNLMASMRIYRMNIPLDFTPEFFQD
ncbi:MAG: class IV aminotransferase, partial [Algoriella sp.]